MPPTRPESHEAQMKPTRSGYADVNGIKLYHEIYGEGEPLVLIHGGLTTIGEMQGWVQPLAHTRRVIAVEMQGHGRTADTDRPMTYATMGDDIAALLDHLNIPKADVVGHSFGGSSAIRTAIQHPDKVRRLVVISVAVCEVRLVSGGAEGHAPGRRVDGRTDDADTDGQVLERMARAAALSAVPGQDGEDDAATTMTGPLGSRGSPMPVLLVFADNDSISQRHVAEFFALLGGGVKEPGWLNTQLSKSRLAVVPGYSHYNFLSSPEVPQIVGKFLADPLTNPPTGATPASQAASGRSNS